jgi:hypothetical protein
MPATSSKDLSATIRLGVYNGVGPQKGLCDGQPVDIRVKYSESYTLEYPSISGEIYAFLQKHYYVDVVYGKNGFLYLTPFGDNAGEKNFSISVTSAANPVVFGSAGTKLRLFSEDLDFKTFNACCLGKLPEAKLLTLTKVIPGNKRTDLLFGPNCKGLVKLFEKAGVEDISDSKCWESELNLNKAVLDKDYVTSCESTLVNGLLEELLEFYESPEFEKKCKKADKNADLSGAKKYEGKSVNCIAKIMRKDAAAI